VTLKALRTQAALKLAPWLKPKGREWVIYGCSERGGKTMANLDWTAIKAISGTKPSRLQNHAEMALAEARLGSIGEQPFGRCHEIARTLEGGLR
jgi:hypothetical protein